LKLIFKFVLWEPSLEECEIFPLEDLVSSLCLSLSRSVLPVSFEFAAFIPLLLLALSLVMDKFNQFNKLM
jgi:hypothetical protein